VLCVGDSSVYGVYVPEADAFPARLERLLNEGDPRTPHRVVNRGIPGSNSVQVAARLPVEIPRFRPRVIVWHAGANDLWTLPDADAAAPPWTDGLRVVRLARLLSARFGRERRSALEEGRTAVPVWEAREGGEVVFDLQYRSAELSAEREAAALRAALGRLRRLAEASGAVPIALLYPGRSGAYAVVNAALAAAAAAEAIATVDPAPSFERAVAAAGRESLFFPDFHPQPLGHEIFARLLHDAIAERGLVERSMLGDPLEGLALPPRPLRPDLSGDRARPDIRIVGSLEEREGPRIEIRDRPGLHFRLLLSLADRPASRLGTLEVHLASDALWGASFARREFVGTFDAVGLAQVPLRGILGDQAPPRGLKFHAAYGILLSPENPWVLAVSGSVPLVLE
jgi:lysophospholipase L1-like esterase